MRSRVGNYTNSEIRMLIDEWLHSERDREILAYRLIDGLTIEQIANRYQTSHPDRPVSVDTVKRTIRKCEAQLIAHK